MLFRRYYLRRKSNWARVAIALAAIILAIPAVLFTSNYLLFLPYADWFVDLHSLEGVEMLSGLIGGLLGIMFASSKLRPGKLNSPILTICTACAAGILVAPFALQLFRPVDYSSLRNKWKDGVCLQTCGHTCMPASISTVIGLQGGHIAEPDLARAAGTTQTGTEFWYLKRALKKRGYEPHFHPIKSVDDATIPSVIGVDYGSIPHAIVLLAKDRDSVTIGEPLNGPHTYKRSTFRKLYQIDGSCITVSKLK